MNPVRYHEAVRALNATLRKVFDATPINEAWSVHAIGGELTRSGRRFEMQMLVGCLNSLKKDGLLKEPEPSYFTRIPPPPVKESTPKEPTVAQPAPKAADPLDELTQLSQDLFEMSDKIEAITKAIRAKLAEVEQQGEKFKQLQALLKGLA